MHRKQPRNRLDVIPTGITSANTVRGGGKERRGKAKFPNRDSNPGRVGESHVSEPPTLFGSTFS
ncbi:hypothetical protein PI125_g26702 [Phytophthora idaei]|nr:hypothetical protein PI125_g27354 [Phytophthora idaei]KAG3048552.1 hypothetical protein PI125_g26702 [Phytophthora idaei]